jgi:hypothetical protein
MPHGIWADGSSFSKVMPAFQAEGHEVMAAQYGLDTLEGDVATGCGGIAAFEQLSSQGFKAVVDTNFYLPSVASGSEESCGVSRTYIGVYRSSRL